MKWTLKWSQFYGVMLTAALVTGIGGSLVNPFDTVAQSAPRLVSHSVPHPGPHSVSQPVLHPASQPKVVYFTFDDGPSERYTPQILDVLKRQHVRATFFVVGYRCDQFPGLVKRIRREGHEIGNHGYAHQYFTAALEPTFKSDVLKADESILHACGLRPLYYRPPGGVFNHEEQLLLHALGHRLALWNVDSRDWSATDKDTILRNVESNSRPGAVVLFHDGVSNSRYTVQALPILIHYYKRLGYQFRTLPLA